LLRFSISYSTLIPMIALWVALADAMISALGRLQNPRPYYSEFPDALRITESRMNWAQTGDGLRMASYAPLFANTQAWQWTPNLIWVDSLNLYGTPNYYAQQLFSRNRGDIVLPIQLAGIEKSASGVESLYASASRDDEANEIILKVVNPIRTPQQIHLSGLAGVNSPARQTVLTAGDLHAENSMANPREVAPKESTIPIPGSDFTHNFPPLSLTVLRLKTK
jgi:alpha-N-arabinofuranosidase